ncbi:hypothetical protein BaRGS_00020072 [Batillaria attramentaria]|uniref:Uncharacterized protein n=1 Tax=Batillaria attramentaria TaxID=370345 RepID=A0ABD0KNJ6_9CAEN
MYLCHIARPPPGSYPQTFTLVCRRKALSPHLSRKSVRSPRLPPPPPYPLFFGPSHLPSASPNRPPPCPALPTTPIPLPPSFPRLPPPSLLISTSSVTQAVNWPTPCDPGGQSGGYVGSKRPERLKGFITGRWGCGVDGRR